jgi:hypothetical protein
LNIPFTGNLFIGFKEALGYRESENKYKHLGKYQCNPKSVGIYDSSLFLKTKEALSKNILNIKIRW